MVILTPLLPLHFCVFSCGPNVDKEGTSDSFFVWNLSWVDWICSWLGHRLDTVCQGWHKKKNHGLGVLNTGCLFSHSSGAKKSMIKVSAGLVLLRPLSLACKWPSWSFVYTWSSLCHLCQRFPFLLWKPVTLDCAPLMNSFKLHFLKTSSSKYSHILKTRWLGWHQHTAFAGTQLNLWQVHGGGSLHQGHSSCPGVSLCPSLWSFPLCPFCFLDPQLLLHGLLPVRWSIFFHGFTRIHGMQTFWGFCMSEMGLFFILSLHW